MEILETDKKLSLTPEEAANILSKEGTLPIADTLTLTSDGEYQDLKKGLYLIKTNQGKCESCESDEGVKLIIKRENDGFEWYIHKGCLMNIIEEKGKMDEVTTYSL